MKQIKSLFLAACFFGLLQQIWTANRLKRGINVQVLSPKKFKLILPGDILRHIDVSVNRRIDTSQGGADFQIDKTEDRVLYFSSDNLNLQKGDHIYYDGKFIKPFIVYSETGSFLFNGVFQQESASLHATLHPPTIKLVNTTVDSLTLSLVPHNDDRQTADGYTVHYRPGFGDWVTARVGGRDNLCTIAKLLCGTEYQFYATAENRHGNSNKSDTVTFKTRGEEPTIPTLANFIKVSSTGATFDFNTWSDGGCPPLSFKLDVKKKSSAKWHKLGSNTKQDEKLHLADLDRDEWYNFRVVAHNQAGSAVAEYEFKTLNDTSGNTITIFPKDK